MAAASEAKLAASNANKAAQQEELLEMSNQLRYSHSQVTNLGDVAQTAKQVIFLPLMHTMVGTTCSSCAPSTLCIRLIVAL